MEDIIRIMPNNSKGKSVSPTSQTEINDIKSTNTPDNSKTGVFKEGRSARRGSKGQGYKNSKNGTAGPKQISNGNRVSKEVSADYNTLVPQVTSFSFFHNIFRDGQSGLGTIPRVHRIGLSPCMPTVGIESNPLNTMVRKLYTFVRHANSGKSNYEANDLMLYLISVSEVHKMVWEAERVYGLMNSYSVLDTTMPDILLEALNVIPSEIRRVMPSFLYHLNRLKARLNAFALPATFTYASYYKDRLSTVYLSSNESPKAAVIVYTMNEFLKFTTSGNVLTPGAGWLVPEPANRLVGNSYTVDEYFGNINTYLDRILEQEDMGIMSGDILKAFGDDLMYEEATPADYVTPIVYDAGIESEIRNLRVCHMIPGSNAINQHRDLLYSVPLTTEAIGNTSNGNTINVRDNIPYYLNAKSSELNSDALYAMTKFMYTTTLYSDVKFNNVDEYKTLVGSGSSYKLLDKNGIKAIALGYTEEVYDKMIYGWRRKPGEDAFAPLGDAYYTDADPMYDEERVLHRITSSDGLVCTSYDVHFAHNFDNMIGHTTGIPWQVHSVKFVTQNPTVQIHIPFSVLNRYNMVQYMDVAPHTLWCNTYTNAPLEFSNESITYQGKVYLMRKMENTEIMRMNDLRMMMLFSI